MASINDTQGSLHLTHLSIAKWAFLSTHATAVYASQYHQQRHDNSREGLLLQNRRSAGALERAAADCAEAEEILQEGYQRRSQATTASNRCSSRSHCLVCVTVSAVHKVCGRDVLAHLLPGSAAQM